METWRPVVGYEFLYDVSDHGRVRSTRSPGTVRGSRTKSRARMLSAGRSGGYLVVALYDDFGARRMRRVHRLVLEAFAGPPAAARGQACHLNARRDDNRLSNLAWLSHTENMAQRRTDGNVAQGEKHGRAKLTAGDVRSIRAARGTVTQAQLATRFGVSKTTISFIQTGRNWPSIK